MATYRYRVGRAEPPPPVLWSTLYPGADPTGEVHLMTSVIIDRNITIEGLMVHQHVGFPAPTVSLDPAQSIKVTSTGSIAVHEGATLQMRPNSPTLVHQIEFTGINESLVVGGGGLNGAPMEHSDFPNDVGLWVHGTLDWVGHYRNSWTKTTAALSAGATTCVVDDATGWRVGDVISICPTGAPATDSGAHLRYDERTLTAVTPGAGTTATLTFSALTYAHPAVAFSGYRAGVWTNFSYKPEVLNLTRNVIVGGTNPGTGGGRSHIMVHAENGTVPLTVENVLIRWAGPQKIRSDGTGNTEQSLGRYALHFHFAYNSRVGSSLKHNLVLDCGAHAYVTHGTDSITWEKCVAHRCVFAPFWWDMLITSDRDLGIASNDVFYDRCVASQVTAPTPQEAHSGLQGFILNHGQDNKCIGCVAVGVVGGTGSSGYSWPAATNQANFVVWDFRDDIGHNNEENGVYAWQNDGHDHFIIDCEFFHNGRSGVIFGAYVTNYLWQDVTCYGNGVTQMEQHAQTRGGNQDNMLRRCVFDAAGTAPYAWMSQQHNVGTGNYTQYENCKFINYPTAGFGITNASDIFEGKGTFRFLDPVFSGAQAGWIWFRSDCWPDDLLEFEFTGAAGTVVPSWSGTPRPHFVLRRFDWPSGVFVPEWNAKRVDL